MPEALLNQRWSFSSVTISRWAWSMIRGFHLSVALLNAWIEDLADGITVLRGVGELFESGDVQPAQIDKTKNLGKVNGNNNINTKAIE